MSRRTAAFVPVRRAVAFGRGLLTSRADLAKARAELKDCQKKVRVTRKALQAARVDLRASRSDLRSAQADLAALRTSLKRTRADLAAGRERVARLERELKATRGLYEGGADLPESVAETVRFVRRQRLTYLPVAALDDLAAAVGEIEERAVPGLIIEAGTARGGSAIVMAAAKATGRRLRVYDTFAMIPPPSEEDGAAVRERYKVIAGGEAKGPDGTAYYGYEEDLLGQVSASFTSAGFPVDDNGVSLVKGMFADTLEVDGPVALAHLDSDWYASTMLCLERITPHLSVGGRLVIDDYHYWSGCRRAIDEFFAGRDGFRFEWKARLHIVRE